MTSPAVSGADASAAREELLLRLREQAGRLGDTPLIIEGGHTTGARQLVERVDARIRAYRACGVGESALVGTLAWPPAEFISDLFTIVAVGAVAVPLPRRLTAWELERLRARLPLTHLATPRDSPLTLRTAAGVHGERSLSRGPDRRHEAYRQAATAQITSGTTGVPRAALRSAAALLAEADHYRTALDLSPSGLLACPVPLQHAYGFGLCAVAAPLAGAPVRYLSAERPRLLLRDLAEAGVSLFVGVPPMLRLLAKAARDELPGPPVGFLSAGMPLDAHTAGAVASRLGGRIGQVYGTTETGPICVRAPLPWSEDLRWPGPPLPGVAVRLTDPDGGGSGPAPSPAERSAAPDGHGDGADGGAEEAVARAGVAAGRADGLVTVASPSMMSGYAEGGTVDARPLRGGFVTGDLARWEGDALVLAGRLSTCINVAGVKISPEEIEAALLAHPAVASCLVTGHADPVLGQRIKATVTPDTVGLAELERFCRERLSPAQVPHLFTAVASLPTTETGKVIRPRGGE
ncbi:class I adenylate-forming enzyme family protein [Streptomyces sp. NPDC002055]|uniref:class I adenylate-forming enzyme family protein n=1 Tax=Streptomyces sp. NPDC002055 TaxID=3154534 RepID=UPI003318FF72